MPPTILPTKKELNVKHIVFETDERRYIKLSAKLNVAKLGRVLGKDTLALISKVQALTFDQINHFEQTGQITVDGREFGHDDLLVYREVLNKSQALSIDL